MEFGNMGFNGLPLRFRGLIFIQAAQDDVMRLAQMFDLMEHPQLVAFLQGKRDARRNHEPLHD